MMDLSLGGCVDVGVNQAPRLDGAPTHVGSCNDGVYGCEKCFAAIRSLDRESRSRLITYDGHDYELSTTTCEMCKVEFMEGETRLVRAWDEPVTYEMCDECAHKEWQDGESAYGDYASSRDDEDDWFPLVNCDACGTEINEDYSVDVFDPAVYDVGRFCPKCNHRDCDEQERAYGVLFAGSPYVYKNIMDLGDDPRIVTIFQERPILKPTDPKTHRFTSNYQIEGNV